MSDANSAYRRAAMRRAFRAYPFRVADLWQPARLNHCALCGQPMRRAEASIDHIIPLSAGGTETRGNVQLAHQRCNRRKGSQPPPRGDQPLDIEQSA